jgi:hypothetical protein
MKAFPQGTINSGGMDLRDYFAAEAMHGLLLDINTMEPEQTATFAYLYADAMMKERQK